MNALVAALAGVLFAVGLALSGMTQPKAVIGFLDFFGHWNPSLAFVMVGAIGVYALGRRLVLKRAAPIYDTTFHPPVPAPIFTPQLIGGSALFGIGWGLAGYCPGPSLVALGTGAPAAIVFVGAMFVGTFIERVPGFVTRGQPRGIAVTDS